jgi:hypothetical protein
MDFRRYNNNNSLEMKKKINFDSLKSTVRPKLPENPMESIYDTIVFDSKDFSLNKRDAWLYGIVVGWDKAYEELKLKHKWTDEEVARNKRLHEKFKECWKYIQDK